MIDDEIPVTILHIEDNAADATFVRHAIERRFPRALLYQVETAAEGLLVLAQVTPSVIIADWNLPDVQGLELLSSLRAEAYASPIVVLSGWMPDGLMARVRRLGVRVVKKGEMDALIHELAQVLGGEPPPGDDDTGQIMVEAREAIRRVRQQSLTPSGDFPPPPVRVDDREP